MKITKLLIEIDTSDERGIEAVTDALAALNEALAPGQNVPITVDTAARSALNKPLTKHSECGAILTLPVHELAVKPRFVNALRKAGFHTIGQILPLTPNQIREVPDIGRIGSKSIVHALHEIRERCAPTGNS